ncbi:MAG: bifunctional folylpolyglutamate synthase/dihydrofolate synthase [Oscillospiraceae bacterium]|nr:bifunctional folylpolyglutamate synthase/dihydrofolate synthase [Oscillospiraceae bacterium]
MTYQEAVDYIHSLLRFGSKLGLERIQKLLNLMGTPQNKLKFVHIAGTNGKGSTTAMTSEILKRAGYKVGMYTSPFVVDFRERFQINSQMISKEDLAEIVERFKPHVEALNSVGEIITEFELITAIAFEYFASQKCDIVCLEVGLGGRYDATNIIGTPLVSAITSISLDHTEILGDTVEQIAKEKCGIIKPNGTTVSYIHQPPEALAVIMESCALNQNTLIQPSAGSLEIIESDITGSKFRFDGEIYEVSLIGDHQVFNAITVFEIIRVLEQKGFHVPMHCIKEGLKATTFPARFEVLRKDPLIIMDGAHNNYGAIALQKTLEQYGSKKIVAIMGMMADKDYETAISLIAPLCDTVIAVDVSNPRALKPEILAQTASQYCSDVYAYYSQKQALKKALSLLDSDESMIIICGSLYLAGDMRKMVLELDNI